MLTKSGCERTTDKAADSRNKQSQDFPITIFMSLLAELGKLQNGFCYKHVAPNGALLALARTFQQKHKFCTQEIGFRGAQRLTTCLLLFNHLAKAGFDLRFLFQLQERA
jgi:hypothetical protein